MAKITSGKGLNKAKSRRRGHSIDRGKYVRQRNRTTINKAKARKLHLENHPNDNQAKIKIKIATNKHII